MPAISETFWQKRTPLMDSCHYLDKWTDWYAMAIRWLALRRLRPHIQQLAPQNRIPRDPARILDMGCGDGQGAQLFRSACGIFAEVTGVDMYEYSGVRGRVERFIQADGEQVGRELQGEQFDLAIALTSLAFMKNWKVAAAQIRDLTSWMLVVENVQDPAPTWQSDLDYKTHLSWPVLVRGMEEAGWQVVIAQPINWLDRALLVRVPTWLRPLTVGLTLLLDVVGVYVWGLPVAKCRYTAALFVKRPVV
ncbi:MAG: class I SAM-dependent methyltransferase [Chloroflexi bacterium]|nr:class I SAM-dependent methyltransferase [Chloroflexota bacterium]